MTRMLVEQHRQKHSAAFYRDGVLREQRHLRAHR